MLRESDFPPELVLGGLSLSLSYRFAPGQQDDGITVTIPAGVLQSISAQSLEWSVPGMLPAVLEHWLRTLPKAKRKTLAPLPEKLETLTARLLRPETYRQGRLLSVLATLLSDLYRLQVGAEDWDVERIPEHLRLCCKVVDEKGSVLALGRDLQVLKGKLSGAAPTQADFRNTSDVISKNFRRRYPTTWCCRPTVGPRWGFPACVMWSLLRPIKGARGLQSAGRRCIFSTAAEREAANRQGYAQLAPQLLGKPAQFFRRELGKHKQLGLFLPPWGMRRRWPNSSCSVSLGTATLMGKSYRKLVRTSISVCRPSAARWPRCSS